MRIPYIIDHGYKAKHRLEIPSHLHVKNHMHDNRDWGSNDRKPIDELEQYLIDNNIKFSTISSYNKLTMYLLNTLDEDLLALLLRFEGIKAS